MRLEVVKRKTDKVLKLYGIVLMKGDTLYTYAANIIEAYEKVFGMAGEAAAASVRCIMLIEEI